MISFGRAHGGLSQTQFAIAESEGRWPRIYALACVSTGGRAANGSESAETRSRQAPVAAGAWQSEGCHVL